jgi:hypothetical protein
MPQFVFRFTWDVTKPRLAMERGKELQGTRAVLGGQVPGSAASSDSRASIAHFFR